MFEVIQSHNLMHLATIDSDGLPCVRGVDYAADKNEAVLYFMTQKTSRKIEHLAKNSTVGFAVDHDCPTFEDLAVVKYIKGRGTAAVVEDPEEIQKASGLLMQKFPFLANLPGDVSDFAIIRVELTNVLVTDNTISFGYTEEVNP